jgi:hypothetical protein
VIAAWKVMALIFQMLCYAMWWALLGAFAGGFYIIL